MVDVGVAIPPRTAETTEEELQMHYDLLNLIQKCTPADKNSPLAQYLPGFTSLRILLTQQYRSARDDELLKSILTCFDSYRKVGRSDPDIATMTARDFMVLSKQKSSVNGVSESNVSQRQCYAGEPQRQQQQIQAAAMTLAQQLSQATGQTNGMNSAQGNSGTVEVPLQQFTLSTSSHGVQEQLPSLSVGASPALQPITSQQGESTELAPLGLSASQLAALLQNDAQF